MSINILDAVKNFYQIQALGFLTESKLVPFQHSHEKFNEDFMAYKKAYEDKLARAIYDYIAIVCSCELRHMEDKADNYFVDWYTSSTCRDNVGRYSVEYRPDSIIKAAMIGFGPDVKWASSYGGKKWWAIAKAGTYYNNLPNTVFIDHAVDLSHNNSVFFDKGMGIFTLWDHGEYTNFLDLKRYCEPEELIWGLKKHSIHNYRMWEYATFSDEIGEFITRAVNLGLLDANHRPVHRIVRNNYDSHVAAREIMGYTPVNWGKKDFPMNLNISLADLKKLAERDKVTVCAIYNLFKPYV